jgi:hypothetical protein
MRMIMKTDGVLAVVSTAKPFSDLSTRPTTGSCHQNFAGALRSKATQAVVNTLIDAFPQCRAFTDAYGSHEVSDGKELSNMVSSVLPASIISIPR